MVTSLDSREYIWAFASCYLTSATATSVDGANTSSSTPFNRISCKSPGGTSLTTSSFESNRSFPTLPTPRSNPVNYAVCFYNSCPLTIKITALSSRLPARAVRIRTSAFVNSVFLLEDLFFMWRSSQKQEYSRGKFGEYGEKRRTKRTR